MRKGLRILIALALLGPAPGARADRVEDVVRAELERRQIPGLSLAVIQDGKIVRAECYGVIEKGGERRVTTTTLFQAGSISKPVAALGALRLVEQGRLSMDEDVNSRLTTWKVPENEFTREQKVTLRKLLSHTAGLTVHGFPGYAVGGPVPSLVQILNGEAPANTAAIRVDTIPGSRWRYSGGGYTVMQQLVLDVTGRPYPEFMRESVLVPMEMRHSSYEQPLRRDQAEATATGHYADRSLVAGRWHLYPEMAAAGLWTTPSDLARCAIGMQEALSGRSDRLLSQSMARQLLTNQMDNVGLGVFLEGSGKALRFSHGGRDEGFDAMLVAYADTGQGAAIMVNANDNSRAVQRILEAIARQYHWPDYPIATPPQRTAAKIEPAAATACTGRYELANNRMITFVAEKDRLFTRIDGFPDEEFLPEAEDRFFSTHRDVQLAFRKDDRGAVIGILWKEAGRELTVPRIGPLLRGLRQPADPDPARTERIERALKALAAGGDNSDAAALVAPGARAALRGAPPLAGLGALAFVAAHDVAGRGVERHGGAVSLVLAYRLTGARSQPFLLVHLTADGLVTDFDLVED